MRENDLRPLFFIVFKSVNDVIRIDFSKLMGNLLRNINKQTVRRERIFTYILFSVTHFLKGNTMGQNYSMFCIYFFPKTIFSMETIHQHHCL